MATLYVNAATGDDTRSYATAQNSSTPWQTIGRAAWGSTSYAAPNASAAAQAGDTVLIAAGVYWESGPASGGRFDVALNPANSGSAGNPITFRGVGLVYVRLLVNIRGGMIGSNGRNYIIWDHFQIDDYYGGSVSDTGPVVFSTEATHCQLLNSDVAGVGDRDYYHAYQFAQEGTVSSSGTTITGTGTSFTSYLRPGRTIVANGQTRTIDTVVSSSSATVTVAPSPAWSGHTFTTGAFGGNYRGVTLEDANNNTVKNNVIHKFYGESNEAAIMTYDADNNVIEHNEIYDNGMGVFIKGVHLPETQSGNIIRYNYVHDNVAGIRVFFGDDTLIYQNIVTNCTAVGIHAGPGDFPAVAYGALRARIINNTLYGNGIGIQPQGDDISDVHVKNNILSNSGDAVYDWQAANPSVQSMTFDRNLYYTYTRFAYYESGGTYSFATWQGTYTQDPNGVNGSDPLFTTAGSDFHLQGGSPALTLGRVVESIGGTNGDTIPAGAYITGNETIGVESSVSSVVMFI